MEIPLKVKIRRLENQIKEIEEEIKAVPEDQIYREHELQNAIKRRKNAIDFLSKSPPTNRTWEFIEKEFGFRHYNYYNRKI